MKRIWWVPLLPFAPLVLWYEFQFFARLYEQFMVVTGYDGKPDYFFANVAANVSVVLSGYAIWLVHELRRR